MALIYRQVVLCCLIVAALSTTECVFASSTLHFWAVTGSVRDVEMYRKLATKFKQKTGVDVEVTPLAWGNFATKYFTAMAAGLPPDIGVTNLGGPFDYGSVGGLVDLRSEFKGEVEPLISQFNPDVLRMFSSRERLYGLPADLSTLAVYYRKDIFRKLNLEPPKTWSELNRVINRLEANNYKYYFGFTESAQWADELYTMPYGIPRYSIGADGKPRSNFNDPNYQKGILQAMRLWFMHNSPGRNLAARAIGMFRSNESGVAVPMMLDLHAVAGQIAQTAPDIEGKWGVVPWPRADDGKPFNVMGGTTYVIFRQSKMKREAFEWLKFLNSLESQQTMILDKANRGDDSALSISPIRAVWSQENSAFWERPELKVEQGMHRVIAEVFPTFGSTASIHGAVEASRLEANLLDQMGTFIRDKMDGLAQKAGISRTELYRRFGAGEMETERVQLESETASRLKEQYALISPKADKLLVESSENYQQRYGAIVSNLPEYERRKSILDYVKWTTEGVSFLVLGLILSLKRLRKHLVSYLFVSVPVALAVIFVFIPAVTALCLSFTQYHPALPLSTARWVGAENYVEVARSGDVAASIGHTITYALFTLPIGILLSLIFSYLLNNRIRGERFWRFLYFSPLVTSIVSIALIFSQLFLGGAQGWLNAALLKAGLIRDPIPFLTSEHTFMNCVILPSTEAAS